MEKVVKDKIVKTPYLDTDKCFDGRINNYLGFIESNDYVSCSHYRHTDEDFKPHTESTTDIKTRDVFLTNLLQSNNDALYRPFCCSFQDDAFIDPYYKNKNQRL